MRSARDPVLRSCTNRRCPDRRAWDGDRIGRRTWRTQTANRGTAIASTIATWWERASDCVTLTYHVIASRPEGPQYERADPRWALGFVVMSSATRWAPVYRTTCRVTETDLRNPDRSWLFGLVWGNQYPRWSLSDRVNGKDVYPGPAGDGGGHRAR